MFVIRGKSGQYHRLGHAFHRPAVAEDPSNSWARITQSRISILMVVTMSIIDGSQTFGTLQLRVALDTAGFLCS